MFDKPTRCSFILVIEHILSRTDKTLRFEIIERARQIADASHDQQGIADVASLRGVNDKIPCRRLVRRSCRNERALFRLIASAFGGKEHLFYDNYFSRDDDTESCHLQSANGRCLVHDRIVSRRRGRGNCPERAGYLQLFLMTPWMGSGFSRQRSVKFHPSVSSSILQYKIRQPFSSFTTTLWQQGRVSQRHKKALLRALIDKVVVHRLARDRVQARIVWKGGETTTLSIPVPVGALKDLEGVETMERIILERNATGVLDEVIAQELTELGYRSPLRQVVLPSTVKSIRLRHKQFQKRSQSHPRRIEGAELPPLS